MSYFAIDKEKVKNLWDCYYLNNKFILDVKLVEIYFQAIMGKTLEFPPDLKIFIIFGMQDLSADYFKIINNIDKIKNNKET